MNIYLQVFPSNGYQEWLFRENTGDIFQKSSFRVDSTQKKITQKKFDDHFYINLCDDTKDLLSAYFDRFKIDGIPQVQKAFTSSLSVSTIARHMGIPPLYYNDKYSFVLVRLFKRDHKQTLQGNNF